MKKGLTLIELLVVIAIIAVLTGVLIGTFSGSTESARAARCLTNLKNLASAAQVAANGGTVGSISYPLAGNRETFGIDTSQGTENSQELYSERKGWISWYSKGVYENHPTSPQASAGWTVSMYDQSEDRRIYSLTNGAIWKYTGGNHNVYLCPSHVKAKKRLNPNYSYVMNAYFGWSPNPGQDIEVAGAGTAVSDVTRAERRLLFAEVPFADIGVKSKEDQSGYACDAILQYKGSEGGYSETIGFNHKSGKLHCANIVFMDGHVEKLVYPKNGLSESELQDLTTWLCKGKDISFNGKKYEEMKD